MRLVCDVSFLGYFLCSANHFGPSSQKQWSVTFGNWSLKDELIAIAEEMGLRVPDKAEVVDLKALIESSDVYKDDIEFVRNLIDNILEGKIERI
ncbi:hypothetical protein AVEN_39151-1 [Araneus ventricosus]|uniref:Uncharacterized protein n=1 Tax=Araneus ventricosus TaxID=182803 RepID=A0A4Y2UP76_ARAVE|nr:hypothetical protein AVEN_39151-1 [Araneus ventricosus]